MGTTASSSREMDMDEWLSHSGSSGGAGYLKNWKKDGSVDIFLHPATGMAALWSHRFCRVALVKDEKTKEMVKKVRSFRFNSCERESVLRKQRFRHSDGTREYPPELCPFSLLLEWVREAVNDGAIDWCDPIFQFEADDEEDSIVLHAGGFTGLFGKKDITDSEKKELKRAGIRRDEAFMENSTARLQYVFRVVQNDEPGDGCVIAIESQTLGDKMKKLIKDRREDLGEKGDPRKFPVCFRWAYDESETFSDKYDAKVMSSIAPSDEVKRVFEQEPPSLDELLRPSNIAVLRKAFEEHWCHENATPPWDELFEKAEKEFAGTSAVEMPESFEFGANAESDDPPSVKGDDDDDDEREDEDDEEVACDKCEKAMPSDATACPHCGAEYVYDEKAGTYVLKPEKPKPAKKEEKPVARRSEVSARVPRRQAAREKNKAASDDD